MLAPHNHAFKFVFHLDFHKYNSNISNWEALVCLFGVFECMCNY